MKGKIVVTMTAWKRPEYTKQVLDSLIAAEKPKPIYLVAFIEPNGKGTEKLFEYLPFETEIRVNDHRLGGPSNTRAVMERGFELASSIIKLEDDTPIAADALYYFTWALRKYRQDKSVFSICGYNRDEHTVPAGLHGSVYRKGKFSPWGFATWKREFEGVVNAWPTGAHGWDHYLNNQARDGRVEIRPYLSRVQNIGALEGYNCPGPEFHRKNHHTPEWAGNYEGLIVEEFVER